MSIKRQHVTPVATMAMLALSVTVREIITYALSNVFDTIILL